MTRNRANQTLIEIEKQLKSVLDLFDDMNREEEVALRRAVARVQNAIIKTS